MTPSRRTPFRSSALRVFVAVLASLLAVGVLAAPSDAATKRSLSISSPSTGFARSAMKFSGKLSRSPKGTRVVIQRLSGSKWVTAKATRTTTAAGAYSTSVTLPSKPAVYSFRAFSPKKGSLKAAFSRIHGVGVLAHTAATIAASPTHLDAAGSTRLTGTVKPFLSGSLVNIQYRVDTAWTQLKTAKLSSTGTFSTTTSLSTSTSYRVSVPPSGLNAPTVSSGVTVTVGSTPPPTPQIATSSLPNGTRLSAYTTTLTAVGNPAGTWTATPLPAGLQLAPSTGVISGTPTAVGDTSVVIGFTETSTNRSATPVTLILHVNEAAAPVISTTSLPTGTRLSAYTTTLAAAGDPAGTWTASPLPAGLHLAPSTGVISGTPTAVGDTSVVIGFTQAAPNGLAAAPKTLTLHINQAPPPVISTTALPNGKLLKAYSFQLTVAGSPAGTWSATGLPANFKLNPTTGVLSATALGNSKVGTFTITFNFKQTDTGLSATPKTLTLHITAT